MNIAIIGPGNIGTGLARVFASTRHGVVLAGRDADKTTTAAKSLSADGLTVQAGSIADAIAQADVVIAALPADVLPEFAAQPAMKGKILVDVSNPLKEDFSGITLGFDTSSAERIATAAPDVKVVKAFNTIFAEIYGNGLDFGGRGTPAFVASDDDDAKQTVLALARDAGFDAIDSGALTNARYIEPLAYLNVQFGYMLGQGTQITPAWLSR